MASIGGNDLNNIEHIDPKWYTNCLVLPYIENINDRTRALNFFCSLPAHNINCIRTKRNVSYITYETVEAAIRAYNEANVYLPGYGIMFSRVNTAIVLPKTSRNRTLFITNIEEGREQDFIDVYKNNPNFTAHLCGVSWYRYYRADGSACKICCFITFNSVDKANEARLYTNNAEFHGRMLHCNWAVEESRTF